MEFGKIKLAEQVVLVVEEMVEDTPLQVAQLTPAVAVVEAAHQVNRNQPQQLEVVVDLELLF